MKINIGKFNGNIRNTLREAGYHPDKTQRGGEISFSRPLLGDYYPRFHLYYKEEKSELNLHLDHKTPKYQSSSDHAAEYKGELVEKEVKRLKSIFIEKE